MATNTIHGYINCMATNIIVTSHVQQTAINSVINCDSETKICENCQKDTSVVRRHINIYIFMIDVIRKRNCFELRLDLT